MKNTFSHHPLILFAMLLLSVGFISHCTRSESKSIAANKRINEESGSNETKVSGIEPFIDTLEIFVDSTSFGLKGKTKIELRRIDTDTSSTIHLRLFSKQLKKWNQLDEFVIPNNSLMDMQPEIKDFSGDGYYDVLFTTGTAARGANNIQTLVIFDPKRTKLIWVKNSESFPNIRYNAKLRCIDAWSVYGGEMTHFLRLKGDSLIEFASVEHYDHRIVAEVIDSKGNQREIRNISEKEMGCDFCRFVNYDPIEVLE